MHPLDNGSFKGDQAPPPGMTSLTMLYIMVKLYCRNGGIVLRRVQ